MLSFLLHHWRWGAGGGLLALVAFAVLNPVALVRLIGSVAGWGMDMLRAAVEWLRKPHDWWRIGCLSASAGCACLAVMTSNAVQERDVALQQLASVQTTIRDIPVLVDNASKAAAKQARAECARDNAQARADAEARARKIEQRMAALAAELVTRNARERADAQRNGEAVAAGIRAGTVRLRDEWANPAGSPFDLPGVADRPGGEVAAADLRATGTGNLIAAGDSCDADIRFWQGLYRTVKGGEVAPLPR